MRFAVPMFIGTHEICSQSSVSAVLPDGQGCGTNANVGLPILGFGMASLLIRKPMVT